MPREISDWYDPTQVTGNDFYILAGQKNASDHNVYVNEYGYLTEHIDPTDRRDNTGHWNEQFKNPEAFRQAWQPRSGPLELVYYLVQQREGNEPFMIASLGAGLGDFTVDLARMPNVKVAHVDFSQKANDVAQARAEEFGVASKVEIITTTNNDYLSYLKEQGIQVDFMFIYGGLGDNTPLEADIQRTLALAVGALKPGGRLWYVGLEQPFLSGTGDVHIADILGEYPTRPGLITELLSSMGVFCVKETTGDRDDEHPLKAGGLSEKHLHGIYRSLWVKPREDGSVPNTPLFDFKNAVDPEWPEIWRQLKNE